MWWVLQKKHIATSMSKHWFRCRELVSRKRRPSKGCKWKSMLNKGDKPQEQKEPGLHAAKARGARVAVRDLG